MYEIFMTLGGATRTHDYTIVWPNCVIKPIN